MAQEQQDQEQHLSDSQESSAEIQQFGEQSLDEHIESEREEIEALDEANVEEEEESGAEEESSESVDDEDGEEKSEEEEAGDYKPNSKYKVLDEEHEFDPKLKSLLTKETEPIIRELYEKAHGIEAIKASRAQVTQERDQLQGNYNNLVQEVARVMTYKRSGDLQSFFESVQLTDDDIAKYILEKARISQLPPEQQAVYTEREALRRRMNALEQNFQSVQTQGQSAAVQERLTALDTILGNIEMKRTVEGFDARNGKGSFRNAVINYAAGQPKDLSAEEAVSGFMKVFGVAVPKGQPKPGPGVTKRVVARPKVKTIPNYGGGQASVTATKKPRSVEDLRKLAKEMNS